MIINTIAGVGLLFFVMLLAVVGGYFGYQYLQVKVQKSKVARDNKAACRKIRQELARRRRIDYFWKETRTFKRITLSLIVLTILGFLTGSIYGIISSIIIMVMLGYFIYFAYRNYQTFEARAKERLTAFETSVRQSVQSELASSEMRSSRIVAEGYEHVKDPEIFEFPTKVTKIPFPLMEKDPKKYTVIATRKLEFLILDDEYFSVCKNASTFNLLNPALDEPAKKCVEKKGTAGECDEFYYSQVQNVQYDTAKECIRIIFYGDQDLIEFPCKKTAANRKPAMKALKDHLRLTERQRLQKVQEYKHYEEIIERHIQPEPEELPDRE